MRDPVVTLADENELRGRLLDEAERLIFDMAAILDLHKLAPSKLEAARDFLAKLEARDA